MAEFVGWITAPGRNANEPPGESLRGARIFFEVRCLNPAESPVGVKPDLEMLPRHRGRGPVHASFAFFYAHLRLRNPAASRKGGAALRNPSVDQGCSVEETSRDRRAHPSVHRAQSGSLCACGHHRAARAASEGVPPETGTSRPPRSSSRSRPSSLMGGRGGTRCWAENVDRRTRWSEEVMPCSRRNERSLAYIRPRLVEARLF